MAGHSKFANIKHKKEKNDAQKGKVFTRLGRELAVAVKEGGPDPNKNSKLKEAISKAKSNNMPNDTIERSIKKASGNLNLVNYETITYEGYGPSATAILVEVITDNRNRTAANIRNAFTKSNGNLGTTGCVSFMFDKKGKIIIEKDDNITEDELMMLSLESGAEDFNSKDKTFEIITNPENFITINNILKKENINIVFSSITMIPKTYVTIIDENDIKKMNKLLSLLEDEEDVQNIWHNWKINQ